MKETRNHVRLLRALGKNGLPKAIRATLNDQAFHSSKDAKENIKQKFINRNQFTQNSVRVIQARGLRIESMQSEVGSIAPYMDEQEEGAVLRSKGKHGSRIPTSYSAGLSEGAVPRSKAVRPARRINRITLRKTKKKGKNRAQQNIITVKEAAAAKRKFVFMDLGKRKGIFRLEGGKKNPRIKMVHDLSNKTVVIEPRPWLAPAVRTAVRNRKVFYRKNLRFWIKRIF